MNPTMFAFLVAFGGSLACEAYSQNPFRRHRDPSLHSVHNCSGRSTCSEINKDVHSKSMLVMTTQTRDRIHAEYGGKIGIKSFFGNHNDEGMSHIYKLGTNENLIRVETNRFGHSVMFGKSPQIYFNISRQQHHTNGNIEPTPIFGILGDANDRRVWELLKGLKELGDQKEGFMLEELSDALHKKGMNGKSHPTILWLHALVAYNVVGKARRALSILKEKQREGLSDHAKNLATTRQCHHHHHKFDQSVDHEDILDKQHRFEKVLTQKVEQGAKNKAKTTLATNKTKSTLFTKVIKGIEDVGRKILSSSGKGLAGGLKGVVKIKSDIHESMYNPMMRFYTGKWDAVPKERCSNFCFGMCGVECKCSEKVCMDCNAHKGCWEHDCYCSCISTVHWRCATFMAHVLTCNAKQCAENFCNGKALLYCDGRAPKGNDITAVSYGGLKIKPPRILEAHEIDERNMRGSWFGIGESSESV